MVSNISMTEFLKIKDRVKIIDIRSVEHYNQNHIPNAMNVPWKELLLHSDKYLSKDEVFYLYCQKGVRAKQISNILANQGYKVVNILGGYEEWILHH